MNKEVATLSQLPSINEAIRRRRLSLWPHQAYGSGCSPSPTSLSRHDRAQDSLTPGEDNQVICENAGWSRSPRAHGSLLLMLECCDRLVSMEGATTHPWSSVEREIEVCYTVCTCVLFSCHSILCSLQNGTV